MGILDYLQRLVGIPENMSGDPAAQQFTGVPRPQRNPRGLLDASSENIPQPKDFYGDVIYPILKVAEGGYKKSDKDRLDWTSGQIGKGNLVGTNKGVTATALSEYLGVPASSITEQTMRDIDENTAKNIFRSQYYEKYGIDKSPRDVQPVLASAVVLRPSAAMAAKRAKTPQEAANLAIKDFGRIPRKGPFYKSNIRGWVNRLRKAADMKPFKTREQIYKAYPVLTP